MTHNGKEVFTAETFRYDAAKVGDLVTQEVVDNAMDCLPPICMRDSCSQMGEPYDTCWDPKSGRYHNTYSTFKLVAGKWPNGIWEYCGHCFAGENVERGVPVQYSGMGEE